jgi:hypothetical protein
MKVKTSQKIRVIELEILRLIKLVIGEETKLFSTKNPLERINIKLKMASLNAQIGNYQDWKMQLENNQMKLVTSVSGGQTSET